METLESEKARLLAACEMWRGQWLKSRNKASRDDWLNADLNYVYETINGDMNELLETLGHTCMLLETKAQPIGEPITEYKKLERPL